MNESEKSPAVLEAKDLREKLKRTLEPLVKKMVGGFEKINRDGLTIPPSVLSEEMTITNFDDLGTDGTRWQPLKRKSPYIFKAFEQKAHYTYFSDASKLSTSTMILNNKIGVGEYGESFALALSQSIMAVGILAYDQGLVIEKELAADDREEERNVLKHLTFRGTLPEVFAEASETIGASLAAITAEHVPGFEQDPVGLCRQLVDQKVIVELAMRLPTGIVGPLQGEGSYIKNALETQDGKIKLSEALKDFLLEERLKDEPPLLTPNITDHEFNPRTSLGCPVPVGIASLGKIFIQYLEFFYAKKTEK